jgi:ubiquinol-cytochrome c reductase cytochrome c subunit
MSPVRWAVHRRPLLPRRLRMLLALLCGAAAVFGFAAHSAPADDRAQSESETTPGVQPHGVGHAQLVTQGRQLFHRACSSCHGWNAGGIRGIAPDLHGVGEIAADFYLRTGRRPLSDPEDQPKRAQSPFSERQIDALVAYVGSFGGPTVPEVDPSKGSLSEGLKIFGENCMGCHQVVGQGGMATKAWIPDLQAAEPIDVAEAINIGPYVMPHFRGRFTDEQIDSLAKYVQYTQDPVDAGGWGIGHIGPVPEGMVTWLLAMTALLLVIRLIGERTTR